MTTEVSDVKARIKALKDAIEPLQAELQELNRKLLEMTSRIKIGDVIT